LAHSQEKEVKAVFFLCAASLSFDKTKIRGAIFHTKKMYHNSQHRQQAATIDYFGFHVSDSTTPKKKNKHLQHNKKSIVS